MQVYGFLEKAQLENVASDLSNTLAGLIWFNTTDSAARFYDGSAVRTIADLNSAQTLTNKILTGNQIASFSPDGVETITAPVVTGNMLVDQHQLNYMDALHQATPANPASGGIRIYSKNDNQLYKLDSDGNEIAIGTGGGGLDTFYTEDFESGSVLAFATGNNAAFLGGGVLAGTLIIDAVSPLSKKKSLKFTQVAGSLNDYVSLKTIDLDPKQIDVFISEIVNYTYDGADSDIRFVIYDVTNGAELSTDQFEFPESGSNLRFTGDVKVPSTCTQIAVGFQVKVENIGSILVVDDVEATTAPREVKAFTKTEAATYYNGGTKNGSNYIKFSTSLYDDSSEVIAVTNSDHTRFTFLKDATFSASGSHIISGSPFVGIKWFDSSDVSKLVSYEQSSQNTGTAAMTGKALAGDYIVVQSNLVLSTNNDSNFSITATTENSGTVFASEVSSEDIIVEGRGNGGEVITAQVTNIPFTEVVDTNNAWDGTHFLVPETGVYSITPHVFYTSNISGTLDLFVDNVRDSRIADITSSDHRHGTIERKFNKGELLSIRSGGSGATLLNNPDHRIDITKVAPKIDNYIVDKFLPRTAFIKDVKPSGTAGGTFTSGSWQTRDLNTVEGDSEIVSLSANQFVLQPGKYRLSGIAPSRGTTNNHKSKIRNITDSVDIAIGQTTRTGATDDSNESTVYCIIDIIEEKTYELQHRCQTTKATDGFGFPASFGVDEVYSQVEITQIFKR